jgi:RNA polymerase sigma-70 factor (sigma-E family)
VDKAAEEEFREFVSLRSADLMRRAYVIVGGDRDAAKDLLQAAMVKLIAHWSSVNDPMAFVRTVMYRQQISWWRRGWHQFETTVPALPESAGRDAVHTSEVRLAVRTAMFQLTARQRAVLFLRYFEDLPEAEVAEVLGWRIGTVRSANHRALQRLRTVAPDLADLYGNPTGPTARSMREALQ